MTRVYDWQIANPVEINQRNNNLWARPAFYTGNGIMAAYSTTHNKEYFEQAVKWAEGREWKLGERPRHADDQSPGQTYLELEEKTVPQHVPQLDANHALHAR